MFELVSNELEEYAQQLQINVTAQVTHATKAHVYCD